MRKLKVSHSVGMFDKIPPQAVDVEASIIGQCLSFDTHREYIPFLRPEHFYRETHQIIWKAICELSNPTVVTVTQYLRKTGELDTVGGAYAITELSKRYLNPVSLEYSGRVIQQLYIKREIIRIASEMIRDGYEEAVDAIAQLDDFYRQMEELEGIFQGEHHSPVSTPETEATYMDQSRNGQIKFGLTTGFSKLDEHFRFKPESLVICNGHDNVGKTAIMVYLAVVSNRLHGWKWMLACLENSEAKIRKDTIQYASGMSINRMSDDEYRKWYDWSLENFTILRIMDTMTAPGLLKIARRINSKKAHQGFLIDPYNALDLDKQGDKYFNSHEYHYTVTSNLRLFAKTTGCSVYLNTHAVTEALRTKHKDGDYAGFPMPPEKADTEGGGKFANRADDFITFHRYVQHPTEFNITHIHVRKIKETETGGKPTPKDEPVKLRMIKGHFGFFDENGNSPISYAGLPKINYQNPNNQNDNYDDNPF